MTWKKFANKIKNSMCKRFLDTQDNKNTKDKKEHMILSAYSI